METKQYPICCTSQYCGHISEWGCVDCENFEKQMDFNQWKEKNNPYQPDPIWSPLLWVSSKQEDL